MEQLTLSKVGVATLAMTGAIYLRGWGGYFGFCEMLEVLFSLIRRVRLRLRTALWCHWRAPRSRRAALLVRPESRRSNGRTVKTKNAVDVSVNCSQPPSSDAINEGSIRFWGKAFGHKSSDYRSVASAN